ncbi:MAG: hypothetical protein AB7O26_13910 [Planctomycetaceae bacterium]
MQIWLNLVRKEWLEHQWKLLSLTVILFSVMAASFYSVRDNFTPQVLLLFYGIFATIYIAMGVCSAEQSSRTISFTRSQPVPLWKVGLTRYFAGLALLIAPLILFSAVSTVVLMWKPNIRIDDSFHGGHKDRVMILWFSTAILTLGFVNLYGWITAIAVNVKSEFRAGLVALLVTVAVAALAMYGSDRRQFGQLHLYQVFLLLPGPMGVMSKPILARSEFEYLIPWIIVVQIIVDIILACVMIRRYGRENERLAAVAAALPTFTDLIRRIPRFERLGPVTLDRPHVSPWRALVWLQLRQSIPVCIVAVLLLFGSAIALDPRETRVVAISFFPFVGCMLALVIGNGSYVHELDPKLYSFWRSRPISPAHWFWLKFLAGLLAFLFVFDLPILLLLDSTTRRAPIYNGYGVWFPLMLHLLVYSVAVLSACAFRHPVYSIVLAVCGIVGFLVGPALVPEITNFFQLWSHAASDEPIASHALLQATIWTMPLSLLATGAAAFLIKRDIALTA